MSCLRKEERYSQLGSRHLFYLFGAAFFMKKNMTFHKRKIWVVLLCCILMMTGLIGRLVYLMCFRSDYYYKKAKELHEREREIKAARGEILDARGKVLASNRTVCTISVIHISTASISLILPVLWNPKLDPLTPENNEMRL